MNALVAELRAVRRQCAKRYAHLVWTNLLRSLPARKAPEIAGARKTFDAVIAKGILRQVANEGDPPPLLAYYVNCAAEADE